MLQLICSPKSFKIIILTFLWTSVRLFQWAPISLATSHASLISGNFSLYNDLCSVVNNKNEVHDCNFTTGRAAGVPTLVPAGLTCGFACVTRLVCGCKIYGFDCCVTCGCTLNPIKAIEGSF